MILLVGADLAAWIAKTANFRFLTSATKAQLEMGSEISKEVKDLRDVASTMIRSYNRDEGWVKYHAETLAELVDEEPADVSRFEQAVTERKAIDLWYDGYHQQAISKIEKLLASPTPLDEQTRGWMEQLAARIADMWGNKSRAEDFQRQAFAHNRNLIRPTVRPPYVALAQPGPQELAIVGQLRDYRLRRGFLQEFEDRVSYLNANSSANQFEGALADLGRMIGLSAEQHDTNGEGPDVLWLLPQKVGLVRRDRLLLMLDMTEALRPSELFALRWRSFDDQNTLTLTETVYRRTLRPFGKTPGSLTKVHLPDGLADELLRWKMECKKTSCKNAFCTEPEHRKASSDEFIFQNADGGFMDADNYRFRVLKPLAESLGIPKLNFQIMRRTMATQAQKMGSVKDIQAHLRHSRPDTTANEYMQELPESVQSMVGSVYAMLMKGGENQFPTICHKKPQMSRPLHRLSC